MVQHKTHIIVIGAGYAGLLATVRMAMKTRRDDVHITLINPSENFVERPRLHQFAANQELKNRPINQVLKGTGAQLLVAEVQSINRKAQELTVSDSDGIHTMRYDHLLLTTGSTIDLKNVPGASQFAYTLTPAGPRSATALRALLPELDATGGRLVVVGGGPTGIEAAAEFAESYPHLQVTLVTEGKLAHQFGGKIQAHIRTALAHLGVSVLEQLAVERLEPAKLVTSSGEVIDFDICLWAGGFIASPLARQAGLMVNKQDQVLTDPFMRSISDLHIYAAGDSGLPVSSPGIPVRMAAYTAAITGAHAADCLVDVIHGREPKPLNFAYLGQAVALGRHDTIAFNNYPDDRPKNPILTGLAGVLGRAFFVNLLADLPGYERRLPGLHFWPVPIRLKPVLGDHQGKPQTNRKPL